MAERPIFIAMKNKPFYRVMHASFVWNGGFALSQSRKNIQAMHREYHKLHPDGKILEISSKSEQSLGVQLSAFNLMTYVPSLGKEVPVECVFQAGKVFADGGPYLDLLERSPKDAKRDERLKTSGRIIGFRFEETDYPSEPKTAFYDWMYYTALKNNADLFSQLQEYDAFTDIAFNPERSLNCQAQTAAKIIGIITSEQTELLNSFDDFMLSF